MKTPNLFDYATSELSQDAFLCWLISWADQSYQNVNPHLHILAQNFVKELIQEPTLTIESIEVHKQWYNIDVSVLINNQYFLVIEDKKGTNEHSGQLQRYKEFAKNHYHDRSMEIKLVYFKMELQSNYQNVKDAGYLIFRIENMLSLLNKHFQTTPTNQQNHILIDYYHKLKDLDQQTKSYLTSSLDTWNWHAWQGFYTHLQNTLKDGNWHYVANPSGGFLGFFWNWRGNETDGKKYNLYLQLEYGKLVVKLYCEHKEDRNEIRDLCRHHLFTEAQQQNISLNRYGRLGQYMGIAKLNTDVRVSHNDLIDIDKTIESLQQVMNLLDTVHQQLKS